MPPAAGHSCERKNGLTVALQDFASQWEKRKANLNKKTTGHARGQRVLKKIKLGRKV